MDAVRDCSRAVELNRLRDVGDLHLDRKTELRERSPRIVNGARGQLETEIAPVRQLACEVREVAGGTGTELDDEVSGLRVRLNAVAKLRQEARTNLANGTA